MLSAAVTTVFWHWWNLVRLKGPRKMFGNTLFCSGEHGFDCRVRPHGSLHKKINNGATCWHVYAKNTRKADYESLLDTTSYEFYKLPSILSFAPTYPHWRVKYSYLLDAWKWYVYHATYMLLTSIHSSSVWRISTFCCVLQLILLYHRRIQRIYHTTKNKR